MILAVLLSVLTNTAELAHELRTAEADGRAFEFTATVTFPGLSGPGSLFAVADATGSCALRPVLADPPQMQAGDRLQLKGITRRRDDQLSGASEIQATVTALTVRSHDAPPPTPSVRVPDILSGKYDGHFVRMTGTLRDLFRDEIDPEWYYLLIRQNRETLTAILHAGKADLRSQKRLIGAQIEFAGLCFRTELDSRKLLTSSLYLTGPEALKVLKHAPENPFAVPALESADQLKGTDLAGLGLRSVAGRLLAVWDGRHALLETDARRLVGVEFAERATFSYGNRIEVAGYPETDLYRINLSSAIGRLLSSGPPEFSAPESVEAKNLLTDGHGNRAVKVSYHGRPIRLVGFVRQFPENLRDPRRFVLDCNGYDISVAANSLTGSVPAPGSRLSVSGICVIEVANRRPSLPFPHVTGILLVPRAASDVVVLSRPPWWTPARLFTLVSVLFAALLAILAWNLALKRKSERRGRELAAEQLAHVTSELKVSERTRLAVELHDALSQTLTGVSMQIDTAVGVLREKSPTVSKCLSLASRLIDSCRTELRNTLWDLRSAALDETEMNAAIRKTLCQNLANVNLSIRFNVPRETFSDNTAHAILKIIRELTTNALRHGKATALRIAGALEGGKLLFSVRDNGCGFDPDDVPGVTEGHFGLQGITERLERLNGEMKVESFPGKGTRVVLTIPLPRSGE